MTRVLRLFDGVPRPLVHLHRSGRDMMSIFLDPLKVFDLRIYYLFSVFYFNDISCTLLTPVANFICKYSQGYSLGIMTLLMVSHLRLMMFPLLFSYSIWDMPLRSILACIISALKLIRIDKICRI